MGVRERASDATEPPAVLGLVAHPVRWKLVCQLAESDRPVRELVALVGEPQNLVSYHLRKLREGELVRVRRSSADGRDAYYSLDLGTCREQLGAAGRALHPGLALREPATPTTPSRRGRPPRVLFLCTGNSARSQMAEALLVDATGGTVEARSAGSHPKALHPQAVRTMARRGIDISANTTRHVDDVAAERFDVVVTLCDKVREVCPELPSHPRRTHWSVADPAADGPGGRARAAAFERTAVELEARIPFLVHQLAHRPTRGSRHGTR